MENNAAVIDVKTQNRRRIARYVLENKQVSRQEIAKALGYSMPTVFTNINELMEMGFLCEAGEYGSTGGRKAKVLMAAKKHRCALGLDITKRHIRILLLDMTGEILNEEYARFAYRDDTEYYQALGEAVQKFLRSSEIDEEKLIGIGISLPGIIIPDRGILQRSHILDVSDVSLSRFVQNIPYPSVFDNDANCAAYAEVSREDSSTAYFSLSSTVGGAVYCDGRLHAGDNYKSGEFGHMIIHPGGKRCYCGKQGCLDAYCAAPALISDPEERLESFFDKLAGGEAETVKVWDTYLDDLAIAVANVRMALDCNIILGGSIGGWVAQDIVKFTDKVRAYNNFDNDTDYIRTGKYKRLSSAIGAAQIMVNRYVDTI